MAPAMVARVLRTLACHLTSAAVFGVASLQVTSFPVSRVINMLLSFSFCCWLQLRYLHCHYGWAVLLSVFLVARGASAKYQA